MPRSRDRLVDVVLVEDDAMPRPPSPRSARVLLARLPRRVWVVALVLVLAAVAGLTVARRAAEAAREERLAAVDGLTLSLAAPLEEAWRTDGSGLVAALEEVVVLWGPGYDGVIAADVADGSVRYQHSGGCQLVPTEDDALAQVPLGGPARSGAGDVLLCVDEPARGAPGAAGPGPATAAVLDPASGAVLRSFSLVGGGSWIVVGTHVVSMALDPDRHVVADSWSLDTGRQRWSYRSDEPAPSTGDDWGTSLTDTAMTMVLGRWSLALDPATGAEMATRRSAGGARTDTWGPVDLPDGTSLSGELSPSGSRTTVRPAGGGDAYTVPGFVMTPGVDDGSLPGTLLASVMDGTVESLVAVDAATGDRQWSARSRAGQLAVLAGLVVVHDDSATTALDGATGEVRWTSAEDAGQRPGWGLVTDGRHVLTIDGAGPAAELVAREVTTGERVWSMPAPVPDGWLVPLQDGTVLTVGSSEVVALRP